MQHVYLAISLLQKQQQLLLLVQDALVIVHLAHLPVYVLHAFHMVIILMQVQDAVAV